MTTTMTELEEPSTFIDRRDYDQGGQSPARERRQFTNSHEGLSPEARELALAIDRYKLAHRRRFITYEEMLSVVKSIGYRKDETKLTHSCLVDSVLQLSPSA